MPKDQRLTPLVHHCVVTRMTYGNDGYVPKALPFRIDILLPDRRRIAFDKGKVDGALLTGTVAATRRC